MTTRSTSARQPSSNSNVRRNLFNHLGRRPTNSSSTSAARMPETTHDDSTDIVLRDRSGKYQVQMPVLPALEEDQAPGEMEGEGGKHKLEARLLATYRDRNHNPEPGEPAEMLSAVQASLRRKVASLDADNWMFEAENDAKT
ncbi:MAG: hypothetical protein Q9195_001551 [Heterodermia aff. obscurata]